MKIKRILALQLLTMTWLFNNPVYAAASVCIILPPHLMASQSTPWHWSQFVQNAASCVGNVHAKEAPYTFAQLLEDGGLTFEKPPNFEIQAPEFNDVLSYEYAIEHNDKKLAVRYAIRPINMVEIDYEDPHNAAPEPNHLFPMLFQSLISEFSRGGSSPSNEYSPDDARSKFNADWAGVAVMGVTRDFTDEQDQMLLLAPHKNNASDAYVIVLFDDYAAVKPEINAALGSLKFK